MEEEIVCKLWTQEPENFDEEVKSCVTDDRLSRTLKRKVKGNKDLAVNDSNMKMKDSVNNQAPDEEYKKVMRERDKHLASRISKFKRKR